MIEILKFILTDEYTFFGTIAIMLSAGLALNWVFAGIRGVIITLIG